MGACVCPKAPILVSWNLFMKAQQVSELVFLIYDPIWSDFSFSVNVPLLTERDNILVKF